MKKESVTQNKEEEPIVHVLEQSARECNWSAEGDAVLGAVEAGDRGMAALLMFKLALAIPHGNEWFKTETYKRLQAAGSGPAGGCRAGAQELYTLRALEMLRSQMSYTLRLRTLDRYRQQALVAVAAANESVAKWKALLGDVEVNLKCAEAVHKDMEEIFNRCAGTQRPLSGFGALLRLEKPPALLCAMRSILPQYENAHQKKMIQGELEREGSAAWRDFTAAVAAHPDLRGQGLQGLLMEPFQRAQRYFAEALELLKAATWGDSAQEVFPGGPTLGEVAARPTVELADQLDHWVAQAADPVLVHPTAQAGAAALSAAALSADVGALAVKELADVVRGVVRLEAELLQLSETLQERKRNEEGARRAQELLSGCARLEPMLRAPVVVRAECAVRCAGRRLGGGGGAGPALDCGAVLLMGHRDCLALVSDGLAWSRRTGVQVDLARVDDVSMREAGGGGPGGGGGAAGERELVVRLRFRTQELEPDEAEGLQTLLPGLLGGGDASGGEVEAELVMRRRQLVERWSLLEIFGWAATAAVQPCGAADFENLKEELDLALAKGRQPNLLAMDPLAAGGLSPPPPPFSDAERDCFVGKYGISSFHDIDLWMRGLGPQEARELARLLTRPDVCAAVKTLNLWFNRLDAEGAEALSPALAQLTSLQTLVLTGNNIGVTGASHIVAALPRMLSLRTLRILEGNNLGGGCSAAMRRAAPSFIQNID